MSAVLVNRCSSVPFKSSTIKNFFIEFLITPDAEFSENTALVILLMFGLLVIFLAALADTAFYNNTYKAIDSEIMRVYKMIQALKAKESHICMHVDYQEDNAIDGEFVNYYFALLIQRYFPDAGHQRHVMNIVRAFRKGTFTAELLDRECKKVGDLLSIGICHKMIRMYYTTNKPCIAWEEQERKRLKKRGWSIVNNGNHVADLLQIVNDIRRGGISSWEVASYYKRRFESYRRMYKGKNGWEPFLKLAACQVLSESLIKHL